MNTFKDAIKMEQKRILRLIDLTDSTTDSDKLGSLSLDSRGNSIYCYEHWYQKGRRIRKKYLGTPQSAPVRAHVSARFREEQLRRLHLNRQLLESLEENYMDYDRSSIMAALPKAYQTVSEGRAFNKRYEELRRWANADYLKNTTPYPDTENYAIDGTRTRSKGESIFYNIFYNMSVLFRYDSVIEAVDRDGIVHLLSPDFLIQCFDGTLIAIEHLGWYGGLKYGIGFGEKCYYYLQEGFILGKNFFVTSDDKHGGTDSQAIYEVAMYVCKMFFGY